MYISKKSIQRFCSYECQAKWQSTLVGTKNARYNQVSIKCDWCGAEKLEYPCKISMFEHHFCNERCRRLWYANVFSKTNEHREASRIRAVNLLASGKISNSNSGAQIIINNMLDEMKIKYANEYNCKYFAIDNYLPEYNLMIEVMGDYWHANPIKYPIIKYKKQANRIKSDKAKRTYISAVCHVNILYLWESDIVSNPELCSLLVEKYIASNGMLQNYNSFNYELKNKSIVLKETIILPYFEQPLSKFKSKIQIA